ncbi:MAG: DNA mismatch repair endonuclease MutL, partial [Desulfotomaculaceae bacterium]|nr:DNA mismatch repair endonuclease MutL [Desulfotomaculaceae bacterium]
MTTIIILDEFTKNQIAAGEVVERPLSVVKELVENSLDAGARRIMVELDEGGLASITVTDNGCGMGEKDLALAFERHATSKIKCASDLNRIRTLGFRGEAIPSIAAVSRLIFTSKTADVLNGTRIEAVEGVIISRSTAGCPPGSTVVVKDLFFNIPVRKKTMKSPSIEGSLCHEIISHVALARPDVSFELKNKRRRSFYSPGTGSPIDAIIAVYGVNQARQMIPVDGAGRGITLQGFIGKPSLSRSNRNHINVIINGRYVHCPAAAGAVEEAYRTLLPLGRKPVVVLNLIVPPELIDVNVHPSKLEVRLIEEDETVRQIISILRETLLAKTVIPAKLFDKGKKSARLDSYQKNLFTAALEPIQKDNIAGSVADAATKPYLQVIYNKPAVISHMTEKAVAESADYIKAERLLPELNVIGQIGLTYILAEGQGGLYILDQHAAHERVLYEYYQAIDGDRPSQGLLLPVTLELDCREVAILTERIFWFNRAGFVLEYFGGSTFLLRGIPPGFALGREENFFHDMLKYLREKGVGASYDEFFRQIASSMACRNAVKAGDKVTQSAMDALVKRLSGVENPYTCPHGRPTVIHLSLTDLEKKFM